LKILLKTFETQENMNNHRTL